MSENTVFKNEIRINRLLKKIEKLKNQRDHYKEEYDLMVKMVKLYPTLQYDYSRHLARQVEQQRVVALDKRVKEQELLIRFFQKDEHYSYSRDIKTAYDEIIKEECARLNEQMKKK